MQKQCYTKRLMVNDELWCDKWLVLDDCERHTMIALSDY